MTLDEVREAIAARQRLADADPEMGHGDVDALVEAVLRDVAAGGEDAVQAAQLVVELLDEEERAGWVRWYA